MNGELKKLMLEAGYAAPELAGRANKLAALLVKECASIADDWVDNTDNGKNYPSEVLKKHFGVGE